MTTAACPDSPTGAHHIRFPFPDGPVSIGHCLYCPKEQQGFNSVGAEWVSKHSGYGRMDYIEHPGEGRAEREAEARRAGKTGYAALNQEERKVWRRQHRNEVLRAVQDHNWKWVCAQYGIPQGSVTALRHQLEAMKE